MNVKQDALYSSTMVLENQNPQTRKCVNESNFYEYQDKVSIENRRVDQMVGKQKH